ncbi:hypothetical protein [Dysgonomonas massiliensis]|uniref:hypothetical protein n=1 Tax=Dysgonomonas massiliensis TaxID=2040292 RepID=UPI000C7878F9|nr:hypothetical protein [Dysgonomonas massiliensis]
MGLNPTSGNMYEFVTHTWNIVKGKCYHDCSYCYMKSLNKNQKEAYLDKKELKTDLTKDKFIFVGSGTDLFAKNISSDWIKRNLDKCYEANNNLFGEGNKYFFQSKNPRRFLEFIDHPVFEYSVICTTIETNRWYAEYMRNCPRMEDRVSAMEEISMRGIETYVTAEPLMDFDLEEMVECIRRCHPIQVNLGRESKGLVKLPEPDDKKIEELIKEIRKFTDRVVLKKNIKIGD